MWSQPYQHVLVISLFSFSCHHMILIISVLRIYKNHFCMSYDCGDIVNGRVSSIFWTTLISENNIKKTGFKPDLSILCESGPIRTQVCLRTDERVKQTCIKIMFIFYTAVAPRRVAVAESKSKHGLLDCCIYFQLEVKYAALSSNSYWYRMYS